MIKKNAFLNIAKISDRNLRVTLNSIEIRFAIRVASSELCSLKLFVNKHCLKCETYSNRLCVGLQSLVYSKKVSKFFYGMY